MKYPLETDTQNKGKHGKGKHGKGKHGKGKHGKDDQNQDDPGTLEQVHLAKLKQIREILLADLAVWQNPDVAGGTAKQMIVQLGKALRINASFIDMAEQRLQRRVDTS